MRIHGGMICMNGTASDGEVFACLRFGRGVLVLWGRGGVSCGITRMEGEGYEDEIKREENGID
jgi:hypothetical protein